jgi:hypothetical protein
MQMNLDEFYQFQGSKKKACIVVSSMEDLSEEDRGAVQEALLRPDITHTAVSKWFAVRSLRVSARVICSHRNRECACARSQ